MVLLVNLARVIFAPLLEEFIAVFGIGEATAGLVATLVWVGSAVPRVPTGWLLTRVPRHRVILATGAILTAASAFTAAANSIFTVGLGAFLMGLSSGVYFVAANPLVSELYPERVGRAMGIHGMASQLAAVVAAPFVTLVLSVFVEWRVVFVCIGVVAFAATAVFYHIARRTELPGAGAADRDLLGAARAQWRVVLLGVVILGSTGFVWQGLFNFYGLYMQTKGLGSATAKNTLTLLFAAGVPAFFVSGRLADRLPRVPYLLSIVATFVVAVLALTATSGFVPLLVLTAVIGYVVHSLFPALDTYLLDTLPDEHRASAYAVYSAGMMVVQASGSSAVGVLREGHGAYEVVRAATALLPVVGPLPPGGLSYDAIFTGFSLGLAVVVSTLLVLRRGGRLPN
ncbi:arabinose efflux permease [Halogeometricum pallidum JCM 14848]|uniref:Arabinose efflux permease n=1 Tax=Halogeometricum pallidum JCM 14848 TaxID=1227487 RepID=M0CVD8_HALPD|nr:MFS transporter [Halogeometricum pallidum]ELZ27216.1 arabinose efflux permease [Halogeometricum pallidum JCM 14848]